MSVPSGNSFLIFCDRVFDPLTRSCSPRAIEVRDGWISSIKPLDNAMAQGASLLPLFDLRGNVLLPPLIDGHIHSYMNPWPLNPKFRVLPGVKNFDEELHMAIGRLEEAFLAGVGLVRDLGDPLGINLAAVELAASHTGLPRVLASGPGLFKDGRYGRFIGVPIQDQASLLAQIRKLSADSRVQLIKLVPTGIINFKKGCVTTEPQLTLEELKAAVELAHELGKKVSAHCSGEDGIRRAVEAKVDFIEHGYFISRATMDLLAKNNLVWTPTLAPVHVQWNHATCCGWSEEVRGHLRRILDQHAEMVRYAHSNGVRIMAGSDAGGVGVAHGGGLWLELRLLQEAGLPVGEILAMATAKSAGWMGLPGRAEGLRVGESADFVAFEGPVTGDLKHLDRIRWVARAGKVVEARVPKMESDEDAESLGMVPAPSDVDSCKIPT